ncbi:MAG: cell division protein FtsL [Eubacteriales bacterium]|nr:cell division protein FtsL [Eubacteriales bacterium]
MSISAAQYIDGSSARQIQYDVYNENNVLKQKLKSRKNIKLKLKVIASVVLVFAIGFSVMYRYAQIVDINNKMSAMEIEYENVREANAKIKIRLEEETDLNVIKTLAEENLGMRVPAESQTVYIKVAGKDMTMVSDAYRNILDESSGNNMLATLMDKVREFTGLIN